MVVRAVDHKLCCPGKAESCLLPCSHDHAAFCSDFAFCSIFRLAARIISSLRRCRFACLSFLSWLQAFDLGCCSVSVAVVWPTLEVRLYRVIRSGWAGFAGCLGVVCAWPVVGVAVRDGGSWKVGGGCIGISISIPCTAEWSGPRGSRRSVGGSKDTYLFQCPPSEYHLCHSLQVSTGPLQVPGYCAAIHLREHVGQLVNVGGVGSPVGGGGGWAGAGGLEPPSCDEDGDGEENEELWDVERLLCHGGWGGGGVYGRRAQE